MNTSTLIFDLAVIVLLIAGIWQFREPRRARHGNLTAAAALACALVLILLRNGLADPATVGLTLLIGAISGYAVARTVTMIHVPAMVAFQHGAGGVAAFLVSYVELMRATAGSLTRVSEISGVLGLTIGALTFSGSMVAAAKLSGKIRQAPQIWPAHNLLVGMTAAMLLIVGATALSISPPAGNYLFGVQIVLAAAFGLFIAVRIGGADMPVLISFLNATAGLAAAFCGMVLENQLLIAFGATVAASGSILTHVMCKAMNRSVLRIFWPRPLTPTSPAVQASQKIAPPDQPTAVAIAEKPQSSFDKAARVIQAARSVIIIPGYGMALAQAQQEVAALGQKMTALGKKVTYAIHPVAGRMPGHMNVLLAEAGVDYDMLVEMDEVNTEFKATDLALVIGACDVVNPAAIDVEGTPISGMPILLAHEAKAVVCCNFDHKPGYSGVENPLYEKPETLMLTGDAKKTVAELLAALSGEKAHETDTRPAQAATGTATPLEEAAQALIGARRVIIIPGYGMALAKAQFKTTALAAALRQRGAVVQYAIHPIAGRMPGHMNVILAEAEVDYEDLLEMDDANPLFPQTDVALIVGACDVVNPDAIQSEGTPISGMPILKAHEARRVIVCNFDRKPGYSGVPNPLYDNDRTILVLGDAQQTIGDLVGLCTE
jgi:NAD(P) transhydrogenase subunit beta